MAPGCPFGPNPHLLLPFLHSARRLSLALRLLSPPPLLRLYHRLSPRRLVLFPCSHAVTFGALRLALGAPPLELRERRLCKALTLGLDRRLRCARRRCHLTLGLMRSRRSGE